MFIVFYTLFEVSVATLRHTLVLYFSVVDMILIGLDCLPILFIACVYFPHTYCLS